MKSFKNDLLTVGAVIGLVLIAIAPLVGICLLLLFILRLIYKVYRMKTYRYSYFVWQEGGFYRDSGDKPLNESMALMIEHGLMAQGLKLELPYSDTDYDKVQKVIDDTRENYIKIIGNPIDNRRKIV